MIMLHDSVLWSFVLGWIGGLVVFVVTCATLYSVLAASERSERTRDAQQDGWSPEDGAGHIPPEEKDRPEFEGQVCTKGDYPDGPIFGGQRVSKGKRRSRDDG